MIFNNHGHLKRMLKISKQIPKQMKFVILLLSIIPGIIAHSKCSIKMCLRWTKSQGILKIICKIDDLYLPVSIHNNNGKEIALCSIPFPFPSCTNTYNHTTVHQNVYTNETEVTVRGHIDHRMSGNWSCRHGNGRHDFEEYIEVIIPPLDVQNNKEENDDVYCLKEISFNAMIGVVIAIVMLSIIWAVQCAFTRCTGQHTSKIIQWADDIDKCFQTKKCSTFSMTEKKLWLCVCLLFVMLIGGALFGFFEKDSCNVMKKVSTCNRNYEGEAPNQDTRPLQEIHIT